jgi:hypothetical protein
MRTTIHTTRRASLTLTLLAIQTAMLVVWLGVAAVLSLVSGEKPAADKPPCRVERQERVPEQASSSVTAGPETVSTETETDTRSKNSKGDCSE